MAKPKLLVIEDDESIRTQMKWALAEDYEVHLAKDPESAVNILGNVRPSLATLDLGLPPHPEGTSEGLRLLDRILKADPTVKVIVVTGNPDKSAALQAISQGAHDYFAKPIDISEIKTILKRASYVHTLESEYKALQKELETRAWGEMVGTSPGMQEVFSTVRKVATTDVPVLITGESGTGKELIARAVHSMGMRQKMPLVPINCGAIPENLMESELFGHEKGAFTGAHMQRQGKFELAQGGTLFLDEIGELPLSLQVKLLRFLQDHKIERVGGRETLSVDVRIIAATNRNIKKLVEDGAFREDLYYRLAVVTIDLPALRDRGDDMVLLAKAFIERYADKKKGIKTLSYESVDAVMSYNWPGNVRELENRIRRAMTFSEGPALTPRDLGLEEKGDAGEEPHQPLTLRRAKDELEKKLINEAVSRNSGNISKAADELGLTRPTLYTLMKKYQLTSKS